MEGSQRGAKVTRRMCVCDQSFCRRIVGCSIDDLRGQTNKLLVIGMHLTMQLVYLNY